MAIYKSDIVDINLETCNIHRAFLNRTIGSGDSGADHFGIRVFRGCEPVDLTGMSVQGIFLPPQGSPIAITNGNSVSGNEAYVVLPQACYNYDGQFCLSIKLVGGGVTGTMRIVDGMVDNTHSTGTVAPTETVPTYQEILSAYDAMVAATAAANGAIAKPYAQLTFPVKKGDYTIVDGALKRALVDIATSETYTAAHWTNANLGKDLSALKSAFDPNNAVNLLAFVNRSDTLTGITYSYSNGEMSISGTATANTACKILVDDESGYGVDLPSGVNAGDTLYVKTSGLSSAVRLNITFYNGTTSVGTNWYISDNGTTLVTVPSTANKIRVRIYVTNGTIIPSGTVLGISITNSMTNKEIGANFVRSAEMANYIANAKILASGDLNEISGNMCGILISANTYTHAPFTIGTIINLDFSATLSVQFGYQFSSGNMFYRRKSTTWGDWIAITPEIPYKTTGKYVAFGDSLTYGAVWSPTSGTALHRVKTEWQIPTRIALATGMIENFVNEAIGGIGYLKLESGENLVSLVGDYSFDGVELVTIMAGANDKSGFNLGTSADSASENTICGAIRNIIQTIAEKNPKTQIIIIQPTPSGVDGSTQDVWSTIPSGWKWSMNQFDEQVSQLCHDEHVGYLNWWDSTYCRNWTCKGYNGSVGPNYTHPTVDEDYYLLGNFIAGKVASLYNGLN